MCCDKFENKTLGEFLKDLNVTRDLDADLGKINEDESTKRKLALSIEEDIQQYLPDIGEMWGDETVTVRIKDDDAFAVWKDHWMPTIDFYRLVFKNKGVVSPEDFKGYGNQS